MFAKKVCRLLGVIFSVIGAIVLAAGIFLYVRSQRDFAAGEKVMATIDSVYTYDSYNHSGSRTARETRSNVYVSYEYKGQEYDHIMLPYTSLDMYEGQQVELLINPDNPGEVIPTWGLMFPLVMPGAIGGVFLAVGVVLLVIVFRRGASWERSEKELNQSVDQMLHQGCAQMGSQPLSGGQVITTTTTTTTHTSDGREVRREVTTTSTTNPASPIPSEAAVTPSTALPSDDSSSPTPPSEGPTSNPPTLGWGDSL